jgi:SAM-dependent methyltransferase
MPWQYSDEYYTEYTRNTWNESALAYIALMQKLEPFRADTLATLNPMSGEHILDMGTGPGEPALTIARTIGPQGRVTGIDLSEKMIETAAKVGRARGVTNADFAVMDCSKLTFPEASFDAIVSCFGFQIFTDPEKAAVQSIRVLKSGARIVVLVWGLGKQVPALDVIIAPMLEYAEPDENRYLPTPYETGGPGEMVAFLEAAGFRRAEEHRVHHDLHYRDADDYLEVLLKGTPIGHSLYEEEKAIQEEVLRKTRANLEKWVTPDGIVLPAEAVVVEARKP